MNKVYDNIKKICKEKHISQEFISNKLEMSQSYFSLMLAGKRKIDYSVLLQIANLLNMTIVELITYPEKYVRENIDEMREPPAKYIVKKKIDNLHDALNEIDNLKMQLDYANRLIEDKERIITILQKTNK